GSQNGARVTARAEGRIDDKAAVARVEELHDLGGQHGNVTSRSACGARFPGAATRHHSRAPGGFGPASRERRAARKVAVACARCARKRCGSQIWNLCPRPTKVAASVMLACAFRSSVRVTRPSPSSLRVWL